MNDLDIFFRYFIRAAGQMFGRLVGVSLVILLWWAALRMGGYL
jgi:hypothetical protein